MKSFVKLGLVIAFVGLFVAISGPVQAKRYIVGKGEILTENRKVKSFDAIEISSAFDIELTQGNTESLVIEAQENVMEHVRTEVIGNTLKIYIKGNLRKVKDLKAIISFKMIDRIELSGACDLQSMNKFELKDLELDLSGATEVNLNLDATTIRVDASGASEIHMDGNAMELELDISGASEINTLDLVVEDVFVDASGASDVKVFAKRELRVDASGATSVRYKGSPQVSLDASGASSIRRY
jgi:hypothetical protein